MVFPAVPFIVGLVALFMFAAYHWNREEDQELSEMDNAVEAAKNIIAGVE